MIPYGAERVHMADSKFVTSLGLSSGRYFVSIARLEPENSVHKIIEGFVQANLPPEMKLVIVGNLDRGNSYHNKLIELANEQVLFPGGIYDTDNIAAVRYHSLAYLHGHTVGGTNPSLVEALGAGCNIIAHDNKYNRWVAGEQATYTKDFDFLKIPWHREWPPRRDFEFRFELENTNRQYRELLEEML